jgi:four helix bundle protein
LGIFVLKAHFLAIAIGSISEVEYFLLLSKDLNYMTQTEYEKLNSMANETKRMLISFQQKVEQQ